MIELNEDYGYDRPFSCVIETPGYGSVVRILNTAPMTFPFSASVVPHSTKQLGYGHDERYAQLGGGGRPSMGGQDPYGARSRGAFGGQSSLGGYQGGYQTQGNQGGRYGGGASQGGRYGSHVY